MLPRCRWILSLCIPGVFLFGLAAMNAAPTTEPATPAKTVAHKGEAKAQGACDEAKDLSHRPNGLTASVLTRGKTVLQGAGKVLKSCLGLFDRSQHPRTPTKKADCDCEPQDAKSEIVWQTNYAKAMAAAEHQNKRMFVYFCNPNGDGVCNQFKAETLDCTHVRAKLRDYVCVQMPLDAKITIGGKKTTLLDHPSFQEMLGRPGIAIVDFRTADPKLRGKIVSMFPITEKLTYTPERMAVILDLPEGTLTQRTLIYAVRIHPEKPASTDSQIHAMLLDEAESHSQYQADIRLQGHHSWETRFHRISGQLPGGGTAREVCAESWPGERLVEAAVECVRCWRLSSGHWNAVSSPNRYFGYDMKLGDNGIWYATGIFGTR